MNSPENKPCSSLTCSSCKKGKKPGVLHIFNQITFNEKLNLEKRTGTEFDVKELKESFTKYYVKTHQHDNFSLKKIRRKIKEISITDFSENSCIVVVFLSHGLQNNVIAANDRYFCFDEMILKIQSIESLKSKPKIFIIQACRDAKSNKFYKEYVKANLNITPDYLKETYILNSSTELLSSYRSENEGSLFIQFLCTYLKLFGSQKPIGEIFDLVNISLQDRYNQLPEIKRNTGAPYTFGDYCKFLDETEDSTDNIKQHSHSNKLSEIENLSELELSDENDEPISQIQKSIENTTECLEYAKETDQLTINQKAEQFIAKVKSEDVDKWVKICPCGHTTLPENPVRAGTDLDGEPIYVGRASFNYELLPAKAFLQRNHAYISCEGREYKLTDFEILTGTGYSWVPAARGYVPPNAVKGGITLNKEILYIGRTTHDTTVTPGKIQPSHKFLYIPFDGLEVRFFHYEVLVKENQKN